MTKRVLVVTSILGMFVPLAYAASNQNSGGDSFWENLSLSVLPSIVLIAFIALVVYIIRLTNSRQAKRQEQHWERMEQLMERLVKAVESKNRL